MIEKEKERTRGGETGPADEKGVGGGHGYDPGTVELIATIRAVYVTVAPKNCEDAP